jgi:hypothetical protein
LPRVKQKWLIPGEFAAFQKVPGQSPSDLRGHRDPCAIKEKGNGGEADPTRGEQDTPEQD